MAACPTCRCALVRHEFAAERSVLSIAQAAFRYPLQPSGYIVLLGFGVVMMVLSFVPLYGVVISYGSAIAYLFAVVRKSAAGHGDLPEPTDFYGVGSFVLPFVQLLVAILVAFVPYFLFAYVFRDPLDGTQEAMRRAGLVGFALVGTAFVPASVIAAAHSAGAFGALNVAASVGIVSRLGAEYWAISAVCLLVAFAEALLLALLNWIGVLPSGVLWFVGMYLPLVGARTLGSFLYERRHSLGW